MTERELIDRYVGLLEVSPDHKFLTPHEMERRSASFLRAAAHMADFRCTYSKVLAGASALKKTAFCQAFLSANGRNVPETKALAEANPEYLKAEQRVSELEEEIQVFRNYYDIFMNAHVHYRQNAAQLSKESRPNGI